MFSQPPTKKTLNTFIAKDNIAPQREKSGHAYPKEDDPKRDLQKEATVLGTIQILSCLMISSLGAILVSAPYFSHFNPEVSAGFLAGYAFVGSLCFAVTGVLSIISGKKSTKPFAMSSLTASALSSVAAGAGLILLIDSLVALGAASQPCDSEKTYLSYAAYYYSLYETKDCLLAGASLTGVLVVMLIFTALELLLAGCASALWWKQIHTNHPGSMFFLPWSQEHI
ncbi:membrane-spanning 4-domains subfamily A member 7 isoform X1 [Echinops telfairi]|uniref:Membrane-spanning 4-domains subfamily A member 7 isoform X1 n=2 Tax=Echinops telfairi TaxID=9371 RepID=A0AC55DMP8_ECHTE|nr:membrane-spanning 4-domains subfamily A member 7 isoform X1 [Echinops telfairi]XP_045153018.1 membrane-spanning 4-domains subfamily A member 7 isoform X1 [Echinops telfairi]